MAVVYEHWRPDTNECFYVGASREAEDTRPYFYGPHNEDYDAVVFILQSNNLEPFTKIVWSDLKRDCVGSYEKIRIAYQRALLGERLTNRASGGDGFNVDWNDKMRASAAERMRSRIYTPERNLKISETLKQMAISGLHPMQNPEVAKKVSDKAKGISRGSHTPETIQKMRNNAPMKRADVRAKVSVAMSGENGPKVKISEFMAQQILDAVGSNREVSDLFGIQMSIVYDIRTRRTWKHLIKKSESEGI